MISFDIGYRAIILMLEYGQISYEQFADIIKPEDRPKEYKDLASFLKNKGKVSERLEKLDQWGVTLED